ncbi:MAG: LacI family transcriptional regulator [Clostridium sp.]|nr:LacI family transcriptional regulator [Clostridium sp.]
MTTSGENFGFKNLSSVTTDDFKAARSAVNYLIQKGHRRISIIGGKYRVSNTSEIRLRGAVEELNIHGITFDESLQYETARYSLDGAYKAAQRLLDKNPKTTGIFAMSDVMAMGAMRAIADRGLKIPEDISIIGFDGIDLADYYNPKLTTICQLQDELAKSSVEILLRQIEKKDKPLHKVLSFNLKVGESVKDIR